VTRDFICREMKSRDGLRGYRAVWKIIRDRYHIIAPRYVMHVLWLDCS